VGALISQPGFVFGANEPVALRDSALLALLVTTGLREAELCALNVEDLRQAVKGQLCVLVRHGKGNKQRAVPYGDLLIGLEHTERWLAYARTQATLAGDSPVFWSFWKNGRSLRGRLSVRRVGEIVGTYWIERDEQPLTVAPHDLRRTYARLQFEAGLDIYHIAQNMGHTSIEMTRRYIGETDMQSRRNRDIFRHGAETVKMPSQSDDSQNATNGN
jgi:integrase/recombinase XerC